jgi:hypothetical protein
MSDALWHGWDPSQPWLGSWLSFPVWLPWSILIDYVSLFKTRVILQILSRMDRNILIVSIAILIADYFFYKLLVGFGGFALMTTVLGVWSDASMKAIWFYTLLADVRPTITYIFTIVSIVISGPLFSGVASLYDIFFWSGFAPSIWMWLYVVALFVTRTLLRSEKLVNWLRWSLDVDKNPFRSNRPRGCGCHIGVHCVRCDNSRVHGSLSDKHCLIML